jgi:hypothetical protein
MLQAYPWLTPVAAAVIIFAVVAAAEDAAKPTVFNFDSDKAGEPAKGWTAETGKWLVLSDDNAPSKPNVFEMTAGDPKAPYNVALAAETSFKDLDLSVKMKRVSGKVDQGGGPVWRAKDGKNYYVCRWNPLEDNFRLYKVVDGKRTQLATADVKLQLGWCTIRVAMKGDAIECWLEGKKLIEARDDAFKDAGKVGLWTKADAVTHFDDLTISGK